MEKVVTRRGALQSLGLVAGSWAVAPLLARAAQPGAGAEPVNPTTPARGRRPWYELGMLGDSVGDNQLLYLIGLAWDGMADVGECLDTATRIDTSDLWSWPRAWQKTADRVHAVAEACALRGHRLSAGEAYFRSAAYDHGALVRHPDPRDEGVLATARRSAASFERGLELLAVPGRPVRIPYERTTLPGYFFRSPTVRGRAPVLVVFQGRDAWPEDGRYLWDGAIRRGYHCLTFHGPGQGLALRERGLPFRSDWERVVTPVVDFAVEQPEVDPRRVVLMGISMGGALAPRAAAFEKRIHTLIANPGVYSWADAMFGFLERLLPGVRDQLRDDPQALNARVAKLMASGSFFQWAFTDWMWKHGVQTPSELFLKLTEYTNAPVVRRIGCQTLVMDGAGEAFTAGQASKLHDALACPKDYMLFTEEDTGLVHCQTGSHAIAAQRMFDWMDEHVRA